MVERRLKGLGEVIGHVDWGIDAIKDYKFAFHLVA
jgi:hypothetical protein